MALICSVALEPITNSNAANCLRVDRVIEAELPANVPVPALNSNSCASKIDRSVAARKPVLMTPALRFRVSTTLVFGTVTTGSGRTGSLPSTRKSLPIIVLIGNLNVCPQEVKTHLAGKHQKDRSDHRPCTNRS